MASRAAWGHVRKLPSGRYQASYLDPAGNRRNAPTTYLTKSDARGWLATVQTAIINGTWQPEATSVKHDVQAARAITLAQQATRYVDSRTGVTVKTLRDYRTWVSKELGTLGPMPLTKITRDDIRAWVKWQEKRCAAKTLANRHGFISAVFKEALHDRLIDHNPCTGVRACHKAHNSVHRSI